MDTLGPALDSLLNAAEDALIACERPAGLITLAPGNNVVWDNCCEGGGELWLRVISAMPQPQGSQPCDITDLQIRVGLGVVRCMHGLNEERSPTAVEMSADTLAMTRDADILLRSVREWESPSSVIRKSLLIEQGMPLGPLGFCGGWEWTVSFRLLLCGGC